MNNTQTRIYAGGAFAFGQNGAVEAIQTGEYSTLVLWSVHVNSDGNLIFNNTPFVTNGVYSEAQPMNLPARLAELRSKGIGIIFSVGAGGTSDFQNISKFVQNGVPGPGNPLYDNFNALKQAMVAAGGDIDAIDFDNEDYMNTTTMVNFGLMLGNIGYSSVTFCPYYASETWSDTFQDLINQRGNNFVSAIHLQCYSGGAGMDPQTWGAIIKRINPGTLLIPGLGAMQSSGWWQNNAPGSNVVTKQAVAMYGNADWSGMLRQGTYNSPDAAMQSMLGGETFFFYCNETIILPTGTFQPNTAVFFGGAPWWGSAPQCTGYELSGQCTNTYNEGGACPSDLQNQFQAWGGQKYPVDGGFIWMYDSIVNCTLSTCCNGVSENNTGALALAYRNAIYNGLNAGAGNASEPAGAKRKSEKIS
ncbi:hypothetical protein [Chitinophaga sp. S165]|uniref:hypothetical protein n=1 Tax=Chitinophaga sp. S165 TaxID=2135462 RepID=UPI000D70ADC5|nr:hypothetical protein [Chitinophaga sp. S165]PWV46513.1 hypothetical protein C7475_11073 [Chitinophaga sp. S165]